jgi:uncharacterized membrane protein YagU involved in acid resistance
VPLTREVVEAGAVGGLIGGVMMALFAMLYDAATGLGFFSPVRAIAATVLGRDAVTTGGGAILLGLAIHLGVSILFGVVFAAITQREVPPAAAIAFGMFAGLAILVIMSLVVLPVLNPVSRARLMWGAPRSLPVSVAFVIHLLYGLGLALVPTLRRRFAFERR